MDTEDGEAFELGPEAAAVLADNDGSLFFAAGAFHGGVAPPDVVDRLAGAFRFRDRAELRRPRPGRRPTRSNAWQNRGPGSPWCR